MDLSPEMSLLSVLLIGFILGLRHSVEADHVAAVAAIVSTERSVPSASLAGALWGSGHTLALLVVGIVVISFRSQISEGLETALEGVVGIMLMLLGINALRKIGRDHRQDGHQHDEDEREGVSLRSRSLLVGMVHGLAGSAALMLLIAPTIASPAAGMLFILVFGIGSIGGMSALAMLLSLPMRFTASRIGVLSKGLRFIAGAYSVGLGAWIVYEKASLTGSFT